MIEKWKYYDEISIQRINKYLSTIKKLKEVLDEEHNINLDTCTEEEYEEILIQLLIGIYTFDPCY